MLLEERAEKTNFSTGKNRSTAVISGQPAGSEDPGEYKEYFNPRIFLHQSLYIINPVFAAAVNIRRQRPQNQNSQIEVVRHHPWDSRPHGCITRSQEALCRHAEKKVAKHYPCYKD